MADQIEIKEATGARRVVPAHGVELVLGSGPDADIRVAATGVEGRHLRFVRSAKGVRVEAVRPGATVAINGQNLLCKDLQRGDVMKVGSVELRWMPSDGAAQPASNRAKASGGSGAAPRRTAGSRDRDRDRGRSSDAERPSSRRARPRGVPTAAIAGGLVLLVVVIGFLVMRVWGDQWALQSPQTLVELAREQVANQEPQRALDTLSVALRDATGDTRAEALRLEAEIRRMLVDSAVTQKLVVARNEQDLLQSFAGNHLRAGNERSAARELIRLCDQWLGKHRDAIGKHSEGQALVRTVEDLRGRYVAAAALDQPDTAADVLFAARTRLRFQWRDYIGAVARLDGYSGAGADEVKAERDKIVAEGRTWLEGKLRLVDSAIERGDTDNPERDLANIERWSMLPEWAPMVAERRQKLTAKKR